MALLDFIPIIGAAAQKLLDLIPDPNARAKAAEEYQRSLMDIAAKAEAEQREINKVEAASSSIFVSGWRPGIGWVGAVALATYYLPQHIMAAILWVRVAWGAQTLPPYPISMDDTLMQLILGLLGLGALRTFEKTAPGFVSAIKGSK